MKRECILVNSELDQKRGHMAQLETMVDSKARPLYNMETRQEVVTVLLTVVRDSQQYDLLMAYLCFEI